MTASVDYNAVLADLEVRRSDAAFKLRQIEATIAVVRSLVGIAPVEGDNGALFEGDGASDETGTPAVSPPAPPRGPSSLVQSDTFFRLSTPAAVRKYLAMMKRPQKPRAIADALQQGGQVHAADPSTAYMNVHTALKRGRDKDFVQTRNGEWGLADWYSNKAKTDE